MQTEKDAPYTDAASHICTIGQMIEAMENTVRPTAQTHNTHAHALAHTRAHARACAQYMHARTHALALAPTHTPTRTRARTQYTC